MAISEATSVIRRLVKADSGKAPARHIHSVVFRDRGGAVGPRDLATHWIHWYPAKMFHRIPQAIFEAIALPVGSVVLDPFCGSGTVLLEGALRGYKTVGIDVNPLARLIAQVKTTPLDPAKLKENYSFVLSAARRSRKHPIPDSTLDFWFKPEVRVSLKRLLGAINSLPPTASRTFFLIALSSIIRKVSLADPSIAPPVKLNSARSIKAGPRYQRDLARALAVTSKTVFDIFEEAVERHIRRIADLAGHTILFPATVLSDPFEAADTGIAPATVDLILTSPPYCGAQKYVRSLRLEMLSLGIEADSIADADRRTLGTERIGKRLLPVAFDTSSSLADNLISSIKKTNTTRAAMLASYIQYLSRFASECARVLRPGGQAFVTFGIGHVGGKKIPIDKIFTAEAEKVGLSHFSTLVDRIPSRGLLTRRHHTAGRIDDERVVWLRRQ